MASQHIYYYLSELFFNNFSGQAVTPPQLMTCSQHNFTGDNRQWGLDGRKNKVEKERPSAGREMRDFFSTTFTSLPFIFFFPLLLESSKSFHVTSSSLSSYCKFNRTKQHNSCLTHVHSNRHVVYVRKHSAFHQLKTCRTAWLSEHELLSGLWYAFDT